MAVANAWATGRAAVPPTELRHPSSSLGRKPSLKLSWRNLHRRNRNYKLLCQCSNASEDNNGNSLSSCVDSYSLNCSPSSSDWDWSRWSRYFSEIEQAENYASVLKFQLEDAIEKEDFGEAAKLKVAIAEATSKDSVAEIMFMLKKSIDEERYHDASRLCQSTGSGLVGWWVGFCKDSNDPFGRLVHITAGMGRFIAKSYSPRQLVASSPGSSLFEIFVVKDADDTYNMQVVFLKQNKANMPNSSSSPDKSATKGPSTGEAKNEVVDDNKLQENEVEKSEGESIDLEEAAEEGIKSVINFLKERIPELKVNVMRVDAPENITEETLKQLTDDAEEEISDIESSTDDDSEEEISDIDSNHHDQASSDEDENNLDMKLYIGGVLHNKEDNPTTKEDYVRVPAGMESIEKDSFVLHIPKRYQDNESEEKVAAKVKVAAIAAQGISELMPPEVAKAFLGSDKVSPKIAKDVREIVKLAVGQAQKRSRLSEYTHFKRIITTKGDLDPFEGLYVGAFGPYGTEVVQLKRKYGNWNADSDGTSSEMEFFEYVEAVKLTGDLNVPAGQVTFRARIGKGNRLSSRGLYPPELGVVSSYKGQGRIAEVGFKNPKWVEGELLQLNGKGLGPYVKGADLGFLYVVPEQSFLVLFNRLKLPE